jgi:EAL domain-containing protein (putative c-di-GMP-specific phosphodiesterase class I)/GGDEF domain-containing protein
MTAYDQTLATVALSLLVVVSISLPRMHRLAGRRRPAGVIGLAARAGVALFAFFFVAASILWPRPPLASEPATVLAGGCIAAATLILVGAIATRPALRSLSGPAVGLATSITLLQALHALGVPMTWPEHGLSILAGLAGSVSLGWLALGCPRSLQQAALLAPMILAPLALLAAAGAAPGGAADPLAMMVGCAALVLSGAGALIAEVARRARVRSRLPLPGLDLSSQPMLVRRGNAILGMNVALARLMGRQDKNPAGLALDRLILRGDGTSLAGDPPTGEACLVAADASCLPVRVDESPFGDADRTIRCLTLTDLRPARALERQIRWLERHDAETGLLNALGLGEAIEARIASCRATGRSFSLVCLQLAGIDAIRQVHGRIACSALVAHAAERIAPHLAPADVLGTLGGEQFAILHEADPASLAERIRTAFKSPLDADGIAAGVDIAAGWAAYPAHAEDGAGLLAASEASMLAACEGATGTIAYDETTRATIDNRRALVCDLARAIEREELRLLYQPQVYLATSEPFGYEALLRWRHPTRGDVPPDVFIPLAEKAGLIGPIGEWVLDRACAEAATWERPLSISVNVSVLQLMASDFPALVRAILDARKLEPTRLELEVTETAVAARGQRALEALRVLRALGVRLSLDDFGAGFSSFGALRSFRFDRIKMDRSLVQNADRDKRLATLVRAIAAMSRGLGVALVAEGVETIGECEFLRGERLVEGQGFLFGRPSAPPCFRRPFPPSRLVVASSQGECRRRRVLV